ncbi:deoxycytidylate deaminase-like [Babylonia areolata]|uniref:deoxycytidylate deaminase-like n=1 Tax=Babylonia areolata TaxID=304850 RepID=UPI003FD608F0
MEKTEATIVINDIKNNSNGHELIGKRQESEKRKDYLSWDEYFMAVAFLSAQRSKDPRTQVGACIVNGENKIVGIGYNGMPIGCSDDVMPWGRDSENILERKYFYVCHAEMNAILNKNLVDVKNCRIYVALFPCNECAKLIVQSGIREVIYCSDKYAMKPAFQASRILLNQAGIKLRKFESQKQQVTIDFRSLEEQADDNREEETKRHSEVQGLAPHQRPHPPPLTPHTQLQQSAADTADQMQGLCLSAGGPDSGGLAKLN